MEHVDSADFTAGCPLLLRWPSSSTSSPWYKRNKPSGLACWRYCRSRVLLVTGLYLFVQPYAAKWRSG